MNEQALPFQAHSSTSKQAARLASSFASSDRWRVFLAIAAAGFTGLADHEAQAKLGMDGNTQRPRRVELLNKGLIADTGFRIKVAAHRQAVSWKLTPKGEDLHRRYHEWPESVHAEFHAMFSKSKLSMPRHG